jgi:hypothetical protein
VPGFDLILNNGGDGREREHWLGDVVSRIGSNLIGVFAEFLFAGLQLLSCWGWGEGLTFIHFWNAELY